MLHEEVIDILMEEMVEFLESYIPMTSLTNELLSVEVDDNGSVRFFQYYDYIGYDNKKHTKTEMKHLVKKVGRAKVFFYFEFSKDEYFYAKQLIDLLDGYVEYEMSNTFNNKNKKVYCIDFEIDLGSKQNRINFLNKASLLLD